jgi:DNA ligase-associated metallophosphoesterase
MSAGGTALEIRGERLRLLAERALFWERAGTLAVADVHLGKAASFRASALPIPEGTTAATLSRLTAALAGCGGGARRLLLLGDFLHARSGRTEAPFAAMAAWRQRHSGLEIVLVRGNHDRGAGDPPAEWGIRCVDEPFEEPPFSWRHHPPTAEGEGGLYAVAGHLHPAVALAGFGGERERLPCFLFGDTGALLPAFGDFTGTATIRPRAGDRLFVPAGDEVVEVAAREPSRRFGRRRYNTGP